MANLVKEFEKQLVENVFRGEELHQLDHSLYEVGGIKVMIITAAPITNHYFFTFHPGHFKTAEEVIFVCGNDMCVFRIPTNELRELPFCTKGNGRPKTKIDFDEVTKSWYLTFNKDEDGLTQMDISKYFRELKTDDELMATAVALKHSLKMMQ